MGERIRMNVRRAALAGAWLATAVLVGASASAQAPTSGEAYESLRAEAFEAAQWAIASDAADALAQVSARFAQGDDDIARLAEAREDLIQRRDRLEREIERLYARDDEASRAARVEARAAYDAALEQLRAVDEEIETRFPAYSDLTSPQALSIAQTQALLGPDEGLLLVLVNPEAAYVWALSRDQAAWARSETLGEANMAATVAALRASLTTAAARGQPYIDPSLLVDQTDTAFDRAEAHRLYAELIAPVESVFADATTLITVTSGDLSVLPLALLPTQAPTGDDDSAADLAATPWLIDRYALAALPSVSSLMALRCHLASDPAARPAGCPPAPSEATGVRARQNGVELAAFGAPVLSGAAVGAARGAALAGEVAGDGVLADVERLRALPALPGSLAELEALQTRYPRSLVRTGEAATETAVRRTDADALSRARFVVFSTHGLLAGSEQGEPGLVLTPPNVATAEDDGYLTASEAAQLRLNAEFVVLSACNTAASDGQPGGEGLSGLARAFFYAGARSLVVSHWEVSDAATTALITRTFAALDEGDDAIDRARALREGVLAVRANPRWAHPAYWAPFTLVGEPG